MSTKGSKPPYFARVKRSGESEYMQTVGAAWHFKEGDGLVVKLEPSQRIGMVRSFW
ncbi:MAG: hypothetical protein ACI8P9_004155 [Parasphingorhabdus sp.]|jgi:hypothetical protein